MNITDRLHRWAGAGFIALGVVSLSGCVTTGSTPKPMSVYQREDFENNETFSRLFDANVARTCEAARRALLSQGYVISAARPDYLNGLKSFQPDGDVHIQLTFNVVCLPEGKNGKIATAFVNALQDRYSLKKSASSSASLGVGVLGSVSIPIASTDESMVKVASETIPAGPFYDRFFALMQRYLGELREDEHIDAELDRVVTPPAPASAPTVAAPATPGASASAAS